MGKRKESIRYIPLRLALIFARDIRYRRVHKYVDQSKLDAKYYKDWQNVGGYTTNIKWRPNLGEANENRIHNMEMCSKKLTGINIPAGKYLSLMKIIGNPTEDRGFKAGPMLIRGKLHQVAGGGICQVSTTLFNAALAAGLTIEEKSNHSWDLWGEERFIDLGRDATYAYARKDLIIRNPYDVDLVVTMMTDRKNLELYAGFQSKKPLDISTRTKCMILKELTDTSRKVRARGWLVKTTAVVEHDGKHQVFYENIETYQPLYEE